MGAGAGATGATCGTNVSGPTYAISGRVCGSAPGCWSGLASPNGLFIDKSRKLYVCNFGGTTVTPIHLATSTPDHEITVGGAPYQAAFAHGGTTAYVINTSTNDVTPVDVATGQTGSHIPVGNAPDGIWITPGA